MAERSPHERSLYRVIVIGTALSFAVLGAIVGSMKDFFAGNAAFVFSGRTFVGLLVGAAAGIGFWWIVARWQGTRG